VEKSVKTGVTERVYVLGRRGGSTKGALNIGRYLALDGSLGSGVFLDAVRPHVVLICGKRGYGKSFTMGVILEELASLPDEIRKNLSFLVIDTMGIFWTIAQENSKQSQLLEQWGVKPEGFDVEVFSPESSDGMSPFSIRTSELQPSDWCSLFNVSETEPIGILIARVTGDLLESVESYSVEDIIGRLRKDKRAPQAVIDGAENLFRAAENWGIFQKDGTPTLSLVSPGRISILDLSSVKNQNLRGVILSILCKKIYSERVAARRVQEQKMMGVQNKEQSQVPMVWMFIDEAHIFVPIDAKTPATDVLVNEWMRLGRQPGLSLVLATQRPSALHREVMSQSDMVICHRLTSQDDIEALSAIRPTYMHESIGEAIKKMGKEKGVALVMDDTSETTQVVKIRPRKSWHGGDEPSAAEV
jgi:hypothetical protein